MMSIKNEEEKKESLRNVTKQFIASFTLPIPRTLADLSEHSLEQLIGRQALELVKNCIEKNRRRKNKLV